MAENQATKSELSEDDWRACKERFDNVRAVYVGLRGTPGVNVEFAIRFTFDPLETRFVKGERTAELYDEMMSVDT